MQKAADGTREIQAAVIGFGLGGRIFHAAVLHETPGMRLHTIVQRTGDTAAQAYPDARVARSVEEMLADPSIELCAISTANESHVPLARQCLEAGRHVVIDKPMALKSDDIIELATLAQSNGLLLAAYHNRRWDGDFQTIRALLADGSLGRLGSFESHFDRFRIEPRAGSWRESGGPGGGMLFDLGPHLIDQALALFGPPATLWADVRTERAGCSVDDAFDIELTYNRALPLTIWLRMSMMAASPGARFTLRGTGGSYVKYGLDPQEDALKAGLHFASPGFGLEPQDAWGVLTHAAGGSEHVPTLRGDYRDYYAHVRDAILGIAPLVTTAEAAWQVAKLIELARASSESGQRLAVDFSGFPSVPLDADDPLA